MEPDKSEKPTINIEKPPVPVVDVSKLFQPDKPPLVEKARPNILKQLGNKKIAVIVIGILLLLSTAAVVGKHAPWKQELTKEQELSSDLLTSTDQSTADGGGDSGPQDPGASDQPTDGGSGIAPDAPADGGSSKPSTGGSGSRPTQNQVTHTISYTNTCYSPVNITIKTGDTIKFVNNSSRDMWPASDMHPSHGEYSDFDAGTNISSGGIYSFTFHKNGTWGFHDHNKPGCDGTITVN